MFHPSISLVLATLTLLHSLHAPLVYLDFKFHQTHIAHTLCPHDHAPHEFCTGDGICQLHLRLEKAQEAGADFPQLLKKLLFEPGCLPVIAFCFYSPSVLAKTVTSCFLPVLRTGYPSAIDLPPRIN